MRGLQLVAHSATLVTDAVSGQKTVNRHCLDDRPLLGAENQISICSKW